MRRQQELLRTQGLGNFRSLAGWHLHGSRHAGLSRSTAAPQHRSAALHRRWRGTGGLYGQAPELARLDAAQNLARTTDFRQLYAGIARDWWGVDPESVCAAASSRGVS